MRNFIALGGEDEIAFRETVDLVGPKLDFHFAIREEDVGMVPFVFGDGSHLIGESESFGKIGKHVFFFEMMFFDDVPAAAELFMERDKGLSFQRGDASFAGDARLFR